MTEALEDKDVSVCTAALKAIQQYRDKRIIGPLIGLMGRTDGRLKGEAYKFLVKITGQGMGPSAEDWRKWWSYAEREFTFKTKEEGRTSVAGVEYYGIEIFSKRICFLYSDATSGLNCLNGVDVSRPTGPEMISGVRASSMRIESISSMIAYAYSR